jgi:hypothetical protein
VPSAFPERFDYSHVSMPEAEKGAQVESVWLDESVFRDGHKGVDDFVNALKKIHDNGAELAREAAARSQHS